MNLLLRCDTKMPLGSTPDTPFFGEKRVMVGKTP